MPSVKASSLRFNHEKVFAALRDPLGRSDLDQRTYAASELMEAVEVDPRLDRIEVCGETRVKLPLTATTTGVDGPLRCLHRMSYLLRRAMRSFVSLIHLVLTSCSSGRAIKVRVIVRPSQRDE